MQIFIIYVNKTICICSSSVMHPYIYLNKIKWESTCWKMTCYLPVCFYCCNCKEWNVATIFLLFKNSSKKKATVKACRMRWLFLCPRENHDSQLSCNFFYLSWYRNSSKRRIFLHLPFRLCVCAWLNIEMKCLSLKIYCNLHLCFMCCLIIYYWIFWNGKVWVLFKSRVGR